MASNQEPTSLGPNAWLVEELAQNYKGNPKSVDKDWRDLFAGAQAESGPATLIETGAPTITPGAPGHAEPHDPVPPPGNGEHAETEKAEASRPRTAQAHTTTQAHTKVARPRSPRSREPGEPLRGVAARIVTNMEASLGVPTATSFRQVPAKLLEINRKVLNNHLQRIRGGKVSFTHLIGYAVVLAIKEQVPSMAYSYHLGDGWDTEGDQEPEQINVGIAVDQIKADGSRSLVVPVIKGAETMSFREFLDAYEVAIGKVRNNKLTIDDLTGANVTITNPGTIGTVQSVPRLMPGQGTIVGLGGIGFPTEYQAADPITLADLGISKIMTVSSTYDHRIIQGAESGVFLKRIHELIMGEHDFYSDIFTCMHVPYEAVQWRNGPCRRIPGHRPGPGETARRQHAHQPVPGPRSPDRQHQSALRWPQTDPSRTRSGDLRLDDLGPRSSVSDRQHRGNLRSDRR